MSQLEKLWKRTQQARRNWFDPKHPDFCMKVRERIKAVCRKEYWRKNYPPPVSMDDPRVAMEEAGCFFYPKQRMIGPMNQDGSPDLHPGVLNFAEDIDMADMGEFSPEHLTLIMTTIRRSQT